MSIPVSSRSRNTPLIRSTWYQKKIQQTCYLSRYIVIGTHTPRHPYLENTLDMPTQQIYVARRYITAAMFQHACGMCSPKLVGRFFALADFASVHSSVRPSHSLSFIRDLCIADTLHEKVRCCQFFLQKKSSLLGFWVAVLVMNDCGGGGGGGDDDWLVGWLVNHAIRVCEQQIRRGIYS